MPHGTGVESVIHRLQNQKSLSVAGSRNMCFTRDNAARRHSLQPRALRHVGRRL
ncbi:hypothetical protein ACVWXU_001227 [Streptomyces sp. TE33382]